MPKPSDYRHIRLDVADNGFIVDYTEIIRKEPENPASDTIHKDHRELFTFKEGQKALDRLLELKGIKPAATTEESGETKAEAAMPEADA